MMLLITLSISVVLVLGIPGSKAALAGEKCVDDSSCSEGTCVDKVCRIVCGDTYCQSGETCEKALVKCKEGTTCPQPPPKCFPKPVGEVCGNTTCKPEETCIKVLISCLQGHTCTPPPPKCVNLIDPCATMNCTTGYTCQTIATDCAGNSCPPPEGQCLPDNPCDDMDCSAGDVCTQAPDDPTVANCVLSPCATVRCGFNTTCKAYTDYCTSPPCSKPRAQCVPRVDPCEDAKCSEGYECFTTDDDPYNSQCRLKDLCTSVNCTSGFECKTQVIYCIRAPCPPPRAVCSPIDPCKGYICPPDYQCTVRDDDPTQAQCMALDPCNKINCQRGYTCQNVALNCFVPPCPPSYGQCVPIDPCTFTSCLEGSLCTQTKEDPTVAKCVIPPCDMTLCTAGTRCQDMTTYCIAPPCIPPRAECVPDVNEDPCAATLCVSGSVCKNVPVTSCEEQPCPKYKAVCETPPSSCDDVYCEPDKTCVVRTNPCLVAPCPTTAVCVCKNKVKT